LDEVDRNTPSKGLLKAMDDKKNSAENRIIFKRQMDFLNDFDVDDVDIMV
jgi:hypothetical protein